jgi:hypothetical protein
METAMARSDDSLTRQEGPDRVHYATGVMLGPEDFQAEQDYHRSRLARALRYAVGYGTLAGLAVSHEPGKEEDFFGPAREERLLIEPGLAIDRLGRLIEVTSVRCLKLNDWYLYQSDDALSRAWQDSGGLWPGAPSGVAADLFIRFVVCERGKTPAFACNAFDTFDSVTAARLRDGFELSLVLRTESNPPLPAPQWEDFAGDPQNLRQAIFSSWRQGSSYSTDDGLNPDGHVAGQDTNDLFLARLLLPADQGAAGAPPKRRMAEEVLIRNELRSFALTANALARWLGIEVTVRDPE